MVSVVEALAVGFRNKRGHATKKRKLTPRRFRKPVSRSGRVAKEIIAEVSGHSAYERRVMEYIRNGLDKRALKLAKRKLGSHARGKAKREELSAALRKQATK